MSRYFAVVIEKLRSDPSLPEKSISEHTPCDRLLRDSEPSIVCHPDTFVVSGKDLVSLSEIAVMTTTS